MFNRAVFVLAIQCSRHSLPGCLLGGLFSRASVPRPPGVCWSRAVTDGHGRQAQRKLGGYKDPRKHTQKRICFPYGPQPATSLLGLRCL